MLTPVLQQRKHSERLNRESERGDAGGSVPPKCEPGGCQCLYLHLLFLYSHSCSK